MIELKYGTEKHRKVLELLMNRYRASRDVMSNRHEVWETMEKKFLAYMPEKSADALRRQVRENTGEPQHTTFDVPYSYAMLMAAHTYWVSVFLARSPVFQYTARRTMQPEATLGVEALMDYQLNVGGMLVPLYIWLMDVGKYGMGIMGSYWAEDTARVVTFEEVEEKYLGIIPTGKMRKQKVTRTISRYSGNKLYNVRPLDFFPDPTLPLSRFMEGEFAGRVVDVGWNSIVRKEQDGEYFNVNVLRQSKRGGSFRTHSKNPTHMQMPETEGTSYADLRDVASYELLEMTVELVPKEWQLGKSEYPEKWRFTIADGGRVIVGAEPHSRYHDRFEFYPLEYDIEGYSLHKRGLLEIIEPAQNTLSFLLNSHLTNVRKAVNDQIIVDPSRIVMKDLLDPRAGKIVRLKPNAYGSDVRTAVSQLGIADLTQAHLKDMQIIERYMQQSVGVNDSIMGMLNQGGRKSATEVRTSSTFGVNRLKTNAEFFSAMGFLPLAQTLLQTTQQYYDQEDHFRVAGIAATKTPTILVTPEKISGFFDFVPVDGTMPVDRYAQANLWTNLLGQMRNFPQILSQYDVGGIFGVIAQLSGIKNIQQFKINAIDDATLEAQLQAGTTVNAQEAMNAARRAGNPDERFDLTRVPEPGQVPGMGATG